MKKETLIIHTNAWPILKGLEDEQLGKLFAALVLYQREEPLPKLDDVTQMAFSFMAQQVDRDNAKYTETVEKRKAAGQAGAMARWQTHKSHAINSHNDNDNVNDNVNDNDNERQESLPSLSPEEKEKIDLEFGDQAAALIGDVESYYKAHTKKPFPGWYEAVRTFSHNQKRWGTTVRGTPQKIEDIANDLFKGLQ